MSDDKQDQIISLLSETHTLVKESREDIRLAAGKIGALEVSVGQHQVKIDQIKDDLHNVRRTVYTKPQNDSRRGWLSILPLLAVVLEHWKSFATCVAIVSVIIGLIEKVIARLGGG